MDENQNNNNLNPQGVQNTQTPQPPAQVSQPQPMQPQAQGGVQPSQVGVPPQPRQKKNLKKILLAAFSILFLILVIFLTATVFKGKKQGTSKNEIVWWGINIDESALEPLIKEYEDKNPGVSISYVKQSSSDYGDRLKNSLSKGQTPDIFEFHNTWTPTLINYFSELPPSLMSSADYSKQFLPIVSENMTPVSGYVGVPLYFDSLTLFINEKMFSEANLSYPVTWEDVRKDAAILTKRDENDVITQSGIALGITENVDHWQEILALLLLQNGSNPSSPTDELSQSTLDYYTSFADRDTGYWDSTMPNSTLAFSAGKLAMYLAPSWKADLVKSANPSLAFRTIPLPQIAKATPDQPSISYATYWSEGVNKSSTNAAEAWKFLLFLSEDENLKKLHANETKTLGVYPKNNMQEELYSDPILGSVAKLAPDAKSWYLTSNIKDSANGLNSGVEDAYKTAIDSLNSRVAMKKVIEALNSDLKSVLGKYFKISS